MSLSGHSRWSAAPRAPLCRVLGASAETVADHHRAGVIPARPCKPKDKAKVEVAVQVAVRRLVLIAWAT